MRDVDKKPQRVLGSLVGVMLVLLLTIGITVDRKPAHAVAASVTLANSNAGSATAITFEYTITTMSLVSNIFYLSKPASYPNFPSLNSAALTPLTTVWVNGTLRNTTEFLNINGTWSSGIQIWAQSGKFAAGDTIKLQFAEGVVTNPASAQTATWSWRTAQGSGATVESFSATAAVTGGTTTTTSTTTTTTTTTTSTTTTTVAPTTTTTVAPTTTTTAPPTTTTSTTTTTVAPTTSTTPSTTVASTTPSTTVAPITTTTVGQQRSNVSSSPTTTATTSTAVIGTATTTTSSTTTTSTTTTTVPATPPVSEEVVSSSGDKATALVGGRPQAVETKVSKNDVLINAGQLTMSLSALAADGSVLSPSVDGRFTMTSGSNISLVAAGFGGGEKVEIWLYSEPTFIESAVADENGNVPVTVEITDAMASGDHHLVLSGRSHSGESVTVATPITILGDTSESVIARVGSTVVWVLLGTALVVGLILPTTVKRRRGAMHK